MISRFPSITRALTRLLFAGLLAGASAGLALAEAPALQLIDSSSETLDLSIEDLAAMDQTTVVTETEFTDGKVAYRGPLVRDVLKKLDLDTLETVRFVAANDYYVDIPTQDFARYPAILAMEADGQRLSRREKGPLWLMYPISEYPELKDPAYLRRLIWQVVRIEAQ